MGVKRFEASENTLFPKAKQTGQHTCLSRRAVLKSAYIRKIPGGGYLVSSHLYHQLSILC